MIARIKIYGWLVCCICLAVWFGNPIITHAKNKLVTKDILTLLRLGYTEPQIIKQIDASKMRGKFKLTPLQALQLRKAGGTIRLIRAMGLQHANATPPRRRAPVPAQSPVSYQQLKRWFETNKHTKTWIKQQMLKRGIKKEQFGAFALLQLNQVGMPLSFLALIEQLKKRPIPRPRPPARRTIATKRTRPLPPKRQPPTKQKPGVLPRHVQAPKGKHALDQAKLFKQHHRAIQEVGALANRSLLSSDMDTWMALHALVAGGSNQKAQKVYQVFRRGLRVKHIYIYSAKRTTIRFGKHPRFGVIARYYFPMKIGPQPIKAYYWSMRVYQNRWIIFQ